MKYQQVSVDFVNMVFTAFSYLAIAGAAWIFLRLLQACFWLPRHLRKQNNIQHMLQEKVESYEKYLLECEEKEKAEEREKAEMKEEKYEVNEKTEAESVETPDSDVKTTRGKIDNRSNEEIWKERRECLKMLKRELKRVQDGGDMYDWDYLLEEDDKPEDEKTSEINETEDTKKEDLALNDVDCEILENTTNGEKFDEEKKEK